MSDSSNRTTARSDVAAPTLSELAAILLVPAASVGFIRIFEERPDVIPVLIAGLASSILAIGMRYARIPLIIAGPTSLLVLAIATMNALAPGTASYGVIPTEETREALRLVADEALDQFRTQRAPVDAISGFVAAAAAGAWVAAFIVDWAALRLRLAFEPVLPAGLLFVFTSVVGSGEDRIFSTAVFGAAVIFWTVANRLSKERSNLWLSADRQRGPSRLATGAGVFGAAAVALGLIAGPLLPGAGETELLDWRSGGDPTRTIISPFVSIGARLVNQTDTELFKVTTDRASYYRLAGLDTYEDGNWTARGQESSEEDGRLPGERPSAGSTQLVTQTFELQNLGGEWLPAAFAPTNIDSENAVNWIADTGSLIVDDGAGEANDLEYTVESVIPLYTAAELRSATTNGTDAIRNRYLAVPSEVSPVVAQRARELTAGLNTDFDRLVALERYFREFDYSVSLSPRSGDPIEQFLDERIGFCQQFSGTFALMARSLDIPARVAVGFTWGKPVDGEPGTWQITGRHTHAWPEVYFDNLGWVSFEPTPQRGSPAAAGYSEVPAQQDEPQQPDNPFDPTTTTAPTNPNDPNQTPNTIPLDEGDLAAPTPGAGGGGGGPSINAGWIVAGLAVLAILFGLPMLGKLRSKRRRQQAQTPAERVDLAWADAAEAFERTRGVLRDESETRISFCDRLLEESRFATLPLTALASAATVARFAPEMVTERDVEKAETASATIVEELSEEKGPIGRWWEQADPRRLLRPTVRVTVRS